MWISTVEPEAADAELRRVYEHVASSRGKLSDIMRVQSLRPNAMAAHLDLYLELMFGPSSLSRDEREAIAVAVSAANGCEYCVAHHRAALLAYWRDETRVARLVDSPTDAGLPPRLDAMVRYARRLTDSIHAVDETDVDALRAASITDQEILHINLIVAYFNFVNRIAVGLGVVPRPEEIAGYRY